jgi:hypothetical protein
MAIDKIGSKALLDCSVAAADIAPGTITTAKLAGSITNAKLANSTVTINGTAIALGASASINAISWQSVVVSDGSTVTTMVAGRGYFVNNTSAAGIVKLPISASAGDTVAIKDYAGNFATNKLTIQRNGHNIQGVANNSEIGTNRASVQLVYIDATKGWLYTNESNVGGLTKPLFTEATGGTVTTSGDFKIHTFTGDGNFVVPQVGNSSLTPTGGPATVSYLVVAGGGSGGKDGGGGGGAGGFREGRDISPSYTASPIVNSSGLTISAQTYPVTVGGGAAAPTSPGIGVNGSPSVFSTITSAGGGGGALGGGGGAGGVAGGSGGGGGATPGTPYSGGAGNTPPVSPSQGNAGGSGGSGTGNAGGGGGGASATGGNGVKSGPSRNGGPGGNGIATSITGSSVTRAGGGGGGGVEGAPVSGGSGGGGASGGPGNSDPGDAGTANTGGGGGGGSSSSPNAGGAGGKGVVIIRYKFQ